MVDQHGAGGERLLAGYSGRLFVLLTLAYFVVTMGRRLIPPLLPVIVTDLVITSFAAGIAVSVFTVVRAVAQYPGGRYADGLSRTTVLVASLGLAIVGFGVLAATAHYWMLLLGVAVIGAAAGLFVPANRALLSDLFEAKRGRAFGLNMSATDVTGIVAAGVAIAVVEFARGRPRSSSSSRRSGSSSCRSPERATSPSSWLGPHSGSARRPDGCSGRPGFGWSSPPTPCGRSPRAA